MTGKREIKIFSAGCSACVEAIALVTQMACPSCDVTVLDMNDIEVAELAKQLGIHSVPSIVIDGRLAIVVREEDRMKLRFGLPVWASP